ncbi:hypothetical protein PybrP1_009228 [[Pythium] brassicae (nom. inval.)]|nr:hypothetical protein PybrP1_009228 [[Pythium] brassicae (nom. inval.)]
MFLRSRLLLFDPEETRRRKRLRARIIRRNRIKREIEQGLEPSLHRKGYEPSGAPRNADDASVFTPTFGGDSDLHGRAQDRYVAGTLRTSHQAVDPPVVQHAPLATVTKAKMRWQDAYRRVAFQRHEEILSIDSNRKWRQERFGYLLFDRKEFERAAKHLAFAISLGATSSTCWRRLAQSHLNVWQTSGDWDALWDAKAAYEQAMNHLEIACSPFALFEYARVLETLGVYTGALSVCASILQTFPRFQQIEQVKLRFVLLQRYQIFSSAGAAVANRTMEAIEREAALLKCIEYTKSLLLSKQVAEGVMYACVLYMHARMNELLASAAGGAAAAEAAQESSDHAFEELFRLVAAKQIVSATAAAKLSSSTWRATADAYIALAGFFHDQSEPIAAADALARALDLLEVPLARASGDLRVDTTEQKRSRLSLYLELGRNYYQCNQMEKAIRSMEAVFATDHYHEEARASLAAWFPDKWRYTLELEDASQVQIARVIRGIWGRNRAFRRREEVSTAFEKKYKERPYDPLHRRNVARALRHKYAPLFLVQDISARRIQASARRYLYYARIRWALEEQRAKFVQHLRSKQQTRKYRYNRHVRRQLVQLLPKQFEDQFNQEDQAAVLIQRHFRGERVRRAFRTRRDAHRYKLRCEDAAARCLQRFYSRYCRPPRSADKVSAPELLYRAQLRVTRAKERVARSLQTLFRCRKATSPSNAAATLATSQHELLRQLLLVQHANSAKIQRNWRRYSAKKAFGPLGGDSAKVLLQQLKRGQEHQHSDSPDWELAARRVQALYRGKRIRQSLFKIRRVPAPPTPSPIAALIKACESNHALAIEACVRLDGLRSVSARRALFDYPVVILEAPAAVSSVNETTSPPELLLPLQHLVSAIAHNALLRCLVCAGGDFRGDRVLALIGALQNTRSLRVLALGAIDTSERDAPDETTHTLGRPQDPAPEQDDDGDVGGDCGAGEDDVRSPPLLETLQRLPTRLGRPLGAQTPTALLAHSLRTANFTLEELYMESNALLREPSEGAHVAGFLGDFFFARYGRLKKLVLAHMRFSDTNAALLGPALAINTVLQHLDLHGNAIGDSGAAAIATRGLASNRSLTFLSLAENGVGSSGARALFDCLARANKTLVTLVLCNNNVRNDAVGALVAAWRANAALALVDLRGNLVRHEHLDALHAAAEERAQSADLELRLFLARRRFSTDSNSASHTERAQSPLKRVGKRRPAPLSPNAFLKQAAAVPGRPSSFNGALARDARLQDTNSPPRVVLLGSAGEKSMALMSSTRGSFESSAQHDRMDELFRTKIELSALLQTAS